MAQCLSGIDRASYKPFGDCALFFFQHCFHLMSQIDVADGGCIKNNLYFLMDRRMHIEESQPHYLN